MQLEIKYIAQYKRPYLIKRVGRRALLRQRGLLYESNDIGKCSPIGWWKGREVWEAIDSLNIPYNPLYNKEMPPFFTRSTNKNSGWLTTDKANNE